MINKLANKVLVFAVVVAMALSACSVDSKGVIVEGQSICPPTGCVYALHLRSTLWGMQRAAAGASDAMIFKNGKLYTFVWSLRDGWAFATINTASKTAVQDFAKLAKNGNFVNPKSMSDIVTEMGRTGWKVVPASALPKAVTTALSGGMSWLSQLAGSMTSFLVIPAGTLVTPPMLEEYAGIDA